MNKKINEIDNKEDLQKFIYKSINENDVRFYTSKVNNERLDEFVEDIADAIILDRASKTSVNSEDMSNVVEVLSDVVTTTKHLKDYINYNILNVRMLSVSLWIVVLMHFIFSILLIVK